MNLFYNVFFPPPENTYQYIKQLNIGNFKTLSSACNYASEHPLQFIQDAHQIRQVVVKSDNLLPTENGIEVEILLLAIGEAAYTLLSMTKSDGRHYPSVLKAYAWAIIDLQIKIRPPADIPNLEELSLCSTFRSMIEQDKYSSDSCLNYYLTYHRVFYTFLCRHPHLSPTIFDMLSNQNLRYLFLVGFSGSRYFILGNPLILNASAKYLMERFHLLQLEAYLGKEDVRFFPSILKVNFSTFDRLSLLRLCPVIYQLLQNDDRIRELLQSHHSYGVFISYLNLIRESILLKPHPYAHSRLTTRTSDGSTADMVNACVKIRGSHFLSDDEKYFLIASLFEYCLMPLQLLHGILSDADLLKIVSHLRYFNLLGFRDQDLADQLLDICSPIVKWLVLDDGIYLKNDRSFPMCEEIEFKGFSAAQFGACQLKNIEKRFPKLIGTKFNSESEFHGRWEGSAPNFVMDVRSDNTLTYTI